MDTEIKRLKVLEDLLRQDEIFRVWQNSREFFSESFAAYANAQPKEIRNMLWGYADSGEGMFRRALLLACRYMEFSFSDQA